MWSPLFVTMYLSWLTRACDLFSEVHLQVTQTILYWFHLHPRFWVDYWSTICTKSFSWFLDWAHSDNDSQTLTFRLVCVVMGAESVSKVHQNYMFLKFARQCNEGPVGWGKFVPSIISIRFSCLQPSWAEQQDGTTAKSINNFNECLWYGKRDMVVS